VTTMWVQ